MPQSFNNASSVASPVLNQAYPLTPRSYHQNNFRLVRFLAALTVAITHSAWIIYGQIPENDGFLQFVAIVSRCTVCLFFAVSGFLITATLLNRNDLVTFFVGRVLRLMPAIFVVCIMVAFLLGPLVSTLPLFEYFLDWRVLAYVPVTTLTYPDMTLPGVFETAPSAYEVNISIWTLRYEIILYFAMGFLAFTGLLTSQYRWVWISAAFIFYLWINFATHLRSTIPFVDHGLKFGLQFLIGVVLVFIQRPYTVKYSGGYRCY